MGKGKPALVVMVWLHRNLLNAGRAGAFTRPARTRRPHHMGGGGGGPWEGYLKLLDDLKSCRVPMAWKRLELVASLYGA